MNEEETKLNKNEQIYEDAIHQILSCLHEDWMSDEEKQEMSLRALKLANTTKEDLIEDFKTGEKSGVPVEAQVELCVKALESLKEEKKFVTFGDPRWKTFNEVDNIKEQMTEAHQIISKLYSYYRCLQPKDKMIEGWLERNEG